MSSFAKHFFYFIKFLKQY